MLKQKNIPILIEKLDSLKLYQEDSLLKNNIFRIMKYLDNKKS